MWTAGASLAELRDDVDDDTFAEATPHTADDRAYLVLLYREHAAQARQQETLRSAWTCVAFAVIVGLLAFGSIEGGAGRREWLTGLLVCFASALGAALNQKHFERYELHLSIMRSFRNVLAHRVRQDIPKITMTASIQHNRQHRFSRRMLGLQGLWRLVYVAAFLAGGALTWSGLDLPGLAPSAAPFIPGRTPVSPPPVAQPGAGQAGSANGPSADTGIITHMAPSVERR